MPHPLRIRANTHKRDAPLVAARRRQTRAPRPARVRARAQPSLRAYAVQLAQVDLLGAEVRELGKTPHWTYCDQNCIEVDDESDPPRRLIMGEAHNRPWAANHPGARRPGLAAPVLASPRCVLMAAR